MIAKKARQAGMHVTLITNMLGSRTEMVLLKLRAERACFSKEP
jgi:hypothetical protein